MSIVRCTVRSIIAGALLAAFPAVQADVISIDARDTQALIRAIEYANERPGEDIIELAPGSLYALTGSAEAQRNVGLPTIRSNIRILGNGAEIRRYSSDPLLLVSVAPAGSLRLEHITLAEGARGAIVNRGTVELHNVRVLDNSATGAEAIVTNFGTFRAYDSDFSFNQIFGAQRDAGILLNYGDLDLASSMLSANTVSRRFGSLVSASAILNLGDAKLHKVRVLENAADDTHDTAGIGALVNLGNGRFLTEDVAFSDNVPADTAGFQATVSR
jgi:hypothetical protein